MSKWVVVTGGAGFIGSHLCDKLLSKGKKVICVDNYVTGHKRNVKHLLGRKGFKLVEKDICKPIRFKEKVSHVYNLASPASPVGYFEKPLETLLVGSFGVKNMLDLALKNKAKFLQASTSEVYGDPLEHPQKETYWGNVNPIGLRSCYDESKRYAESLVIVYRRELGVDAKIVRIFNTYGPRMAEEDGRIVPNFITQALAGKPITVYGDGGQTRSYCFVSDLVDGIHKMMESRYSGPTNLGNPRELTVMQFAKKIRELTRSKSKIVFRPMPEDDPTRRKPVISKALRELGWKPKISLEEGLKRTIQYFKELDARA